MASWSRLDAVNMILMNAGVRPVAALDTNGSSEAADAERILLLMQKDVQIPGVADNASSIPLQADASGQIILTGTGAEGIISVQGSGFSEDRRLSLRVNTAVSKVQVFDVSRNSFTFGPLEVICVRAAVEIAFENASPTVQKLIVKAASEVYQRQFKGNPGIDAMLKEERLRAETDAPRTLALSRNDAGPTPPFAPRGGRGGGQ